jgi:hypothetical protein
MKKKVCMMALTILALLSNLMCKRFEDINNYPYVATINNEPISVKEFKEFLNKNRSQIYDYFSHNYEIKDIQNFWNTNFNGEIPGEIIKQKTIEQCSKVKIQQLLAKKYDLVKDISYSAFLKDFERENELRKQGNEGKKVTYGLSEFNELTYFNYNLSIMVIQLKEKLAKELFTVSEEKLRDYYHKNKNVRYKRQEFVRIKKISISRNRKKDALKSLEAIKYSFENNENMNHFLDNDNSTSIIEMVFDDSTASLDDRFNFQAKTVALNLHPGEISSIIEDETEYYFIKCIERKDGGYISFEDIRQIVESNYIDEKYNAIIDRMLTESKLQINKKIYDSIRIN